MSRVPAQHRMFPFIHTRTRGTRERHGRQACFSSASLQKFAYVLSHTRQKRVSPAVVVPSASSAAAMVLCLHAVLSPRPGVGL